jgi:hypothetical protein
MMASVSDNIRTLTGVFTTPSPNHDDPATYNWLPDADALGRFCHILCAIKPRRNQTGPPQLPASFSRNRVRHFSRYSQRCPSAGGTACGVSFRQAASY